MPIKKSAACLECGLFRGGGGGHPRAGLGLIWAAEPQSREECGRSLRLGRRFWPSAQPGLSAQPGSPDLVARLRLPSTWKLEPWAPRRHVAPETKLWTPEKRIFAARPGLIPRGPPPHAVSGEKRPQLWGEAARRSLFPRGKRSPGFAEGASLAESRPRNRPPVGGVGSPAGRALGPRGGGPAPSSGGRAQGLGAGRGRGRQFAPLGAGSAAGARRGLWGCRVPGPAGPCPPAMPGFDYKFLEKPKRRLLCPLCGKPMREPVQVSTCGHRFCDTCLQEFLRCGPGGARGGRGWGGRLRGRAQARGPPGLCLRRGPMTSGVPTVTSWGCGDVRLEGGPPRTNP